jgi:hypothetical protein
VIAGAGCAKIAALEGAITIVADASSFRSCGILGYTTDNTLFSEGEEYNYDDLLEDILINKICDKLDYVPPKKNNAEEKYAEHFKFIQNSEKTLEYYNFKLYPQYSAKQRIYRKMAYIMKQYFPKCVEVLKKKKSDRASSPFFTTRLPEHRQTKALR